MLSVGLPFHDIPSGIAGRRTRLRRLGEHALPPTTPECSFLDIFCTCAKALMSRWIQVVSNAPASSSCAKLSFGMLATSSLVTP